ncbi:riboflavin biosynthesis protein [Hymenobacter qilianensis]|uniref:Riboflavin biosynthesis protein n=2 Tax=Hymenobacter qilianensis TaxID=1385715 RepID=A0ACB5PL19_9BACT|nr:bifunctional riboflavin kinase/FAD synthetase [Hymenobacter qilianensis]QNP50941.1 bifunctional riboflavin kinase/FAD synthetase [Hymenobacter qilianensis]GGF49240.1 riboflavin biosynthesis protein [Hymenobacter qilianensis]
MQVFRDPAQFPFLGQAVVTSGTFDGVHVGHQKILHRLLEVARQSGGPAVVITYWPHPRLVLDPPPTHPEPLDLQLLSTLDERIERLEQFGVDYLLIVPFTREFAQLSSEEYIQQLLLRTVGTKKLVIGYDHRFGKNREGGFEYLSKHADRYGLEVEEIPREDVDAVGVSSTRIRRALLSGDIATANRHLGYPYSLTGKVVRGQQLGRTIGFPTANLELEEASKLVPAHGVYAVLATTADGDVQQGMLNIGVRPTVGGNLAQTIEVHLLDFSDDIYEQPLTIQLIARLRDEQKFANLDELKAQLAKDADAARQHLVGG